MARFVLIWVLTTPGKEVILARPRGKLNYVFRRQFRQLTTDFFKAVLMLMNSGEGNLTSPDVVVLPGDFTFLPGCFSIVDQNPVQRTERA